MVLDLPRGVHDSLSLSGSLVEAAGRDEAAPVLERVADAGPLDNGLPRALIILLPTAGSRRWFSCSLPRMTGSPAWTGKLARRFLDNAGESDARAAQAAAFICLKD